MTARSREFLSAATTVIAIALAVFSVAALAYTSYTPDLNGRPHRLPRPFEWFGTPGSEPSIGIALALLILAMVMHNRRRRQRTAIPFAVIAVLLTTTTVLGLSAFWQCHDNLRPAVLTPLLFTASVIKGAVGDQNIGHAACPAIAPAGLDVARVCAIAGIFVSIAGVAATIFHTQADRLRVRLARRVVVIVGMDDDALPLVVAVAHSTEQRSQLVLVTSKPDRDCVKAARRLGVAVLTYGRQQSDSLERLPFWHKMIRLYLLSPGPAHNLTRLTAITSAIARGTQRRIPLIMRIDNPWQARAWRTERTGGTSQCWATDTVGLYEVTACRLVEAILAEQAIDNLLVAGTSPLTLAICMELRRRQIERHFSRSAIGELPALTLVGPQGSNYVADFLTHESMRRGPCPLSNISVDARELSSTTLAAAVDMLPNAAVIIVESPSSPDTTLGTRIAARYPSTPVYEYDAAAHPLSMHTPVLGRLRSFNLSMDLPTGVGHDIWERIAKLKHETYAQRTNRETPATQPWDQLDEFYRASNRREIRNALWMVERIAGHTWSASKPAADGRETENPAVVDEAIELFRRDALFPGTDPSAEKAFAFSVLHSLKFDDTAIEAMARTEHEDWMQHYKSAGWSLGERDDERKKRPNLVGWEDLADAYRSTALTSLATTLILLRGLGYRSRPYWQRYKRTGQVHARRQWRSWTWATSDGQKLRGQPGDWRVRELGDPDALAWSVRNNIFCATYTYKRGDVWERTGTVLARRAELGEPIETFEGHLTTKAGDWVIQGSNGEFWTVPDEKFSKHYVGPVTDTVEERRQPGEEIRLIWFGSSERREPRRRPVSAMAPHRNRTG